MPNLPLPSLAPSTPARSGAGNLLKLLLAATLLSSSVAGMAQVKMLNTVPTANDPLAGPQIADPLANPVVVPLSASRADQDRLGDERYQPEIGQPGKDVIWVPTPEGLIKAMLTVADVKETDYVVDLGSGDGRIAIAAARDKGARAKGIEYNPEMVELARRNAVRAGVSKKVTFEQADIFETDFSDATVVTMYLLPSLNLKVRDTILKMKPGTRVVSHAFSMGEWKPERTINTDEATGYFWIVPANVAGRWAFEVGTDRFATELGQSFQQVTFAKGGPLRDGQLKGATISLTRSDGRVLEGRVEGDQMLGRGWTATRIRTGG